MKRGFTIIEVLVVVAIIAVLASIVIISIDTYKSRSINANIQATLGQIRSESVLYQQTNGSFDGLCNASSPYRIVEQRSEACFQAGLNLGESSCVCYDEPNMWVIAVPLRNSDAGAAWCVDSNNYGGPITESQFNMLTANTLCQ